jgi:DNA polymerase-4
MDIAIRLRRDVHERVGLRISVGVARTKFLAKVASGVTKPDGLLMVRPDRELAFLHPLPVEQLWGVGAVTSRKLRLQGIETVGQVARLSESTLVRLLGQAAGRHLHALAHNRDPRPVQIGRRRRSIGAQRSLGRQAKSAATVDTVLVGLVDRLMRRLRGARRVCRTVVLRLRFDDLSRASRSHTMPEATAETMAVLNTARMLLLEAGPLIEARGITLVGIALTNLHDADAIQLALPFRRYRPDALDNALDDLQDRFGTSSITRAVLLGRSQGVEVPLLPD